MSRSLVAGLVVAGVFGFVGRSAAQDVGATGIAEEPREATARSLIVETTDSISHVLRDKRRPSAEKRRQFQALIEAHLDIEQVSKAVLGDGWNRLRDRRTFQTEFQRLLINHYWLQIAEEEFERIDVTEAEPESESGTVWRVVTRVVAENRKDTEIEFRLRATRVPAISGGTEWKIIDLTIDGRGEVLRHRRQLYPTVMTQDDEALIEQVRAMIANQEELIERRGQAEKEASDVTSPEVDETSTGTTDADG